MNVKQLLFVLVIIVPFANTGLAQDTACIDSDGDGFGWNGTASCTPPNTGEDVCLDTDPVDDGWGWNGITSCRVPVTSDSRNELLIIDVNTRREPDGSVAVVFCPANSTGFAEQTINIFHNGKLTTSIFPGPFGLWSTGTDAEDGWLRVVASGRLWRMYIEGDIVLREANGELHACEWL